MEDEHCIASQQDEGSCGAMSDTTSTNQFNIQETSGAIILTCLPEMCIEYMTTIEGGCHGPRSLII